MKSYSRFIKEVSRFNLDISDSGIGYGNPKKTEYNENTFDSLKYISLNGKDLEVYYKDTGTLRTITIWDEDVRVAITETVMEKYKGTLLYFIDNADVYKEYIGNRIMSALYKGLILFENSILVSGPTGYQSIGARKIWAEISKTSNITALGVIKTNKKYDILTLRSVKGELKGRYNEDPYKFGHGSAILLINNNNPIKNNITEKDSGILDLIWSY